MSDSARQILEINKKMRSLQDSQSLFLAALMLLATFFMQYTYLCDKCFGDDEIEISEADKDIVSMVLKAKKAHLRSGPGSQYDIKYTLLCKHYPLKVIEVFREWTMVKDYYGNKGWIRSNMLFKSKHGIVSSRYFDIDDIEDHGIEDNIVPIMKIPHTKSVPVALAKVGAIVNVDRCVNFWCNVTVRTKERKKIMGWIPKKGVWFALP